MSLPRTVGRAAALTLATGLALGTSAAASSAAPFDLRTGTAVTSGRAHARGKLTFPTSKSVKLRATFDDECSATGKGDGYAAYFQITVVLRGGSTVGLLGRDERGCTRAPIRVVLDRDLPARIDHVILTVLESKPEGDSYSYDDITEPVTRRIDR